MYLGRAKCCQRDEAKILLTGCLVPTILENKILFVVLGMEGGPSQRLGRLHPQTPVAGLAPPPAFSSGRATPMGWPPNPLRGGVEGLP